MYNGKLYDYPDIVTIDLGNDEYIYHSIEVFPKLHGDDTLYPIPKSTNRLIGCIMN